VFLGRHRSGPLLRSAGRILNDPPSMYCIEIFLQRLIERSFEVSMLSSRESSSRLRSTPLVQFSSSVQFCSFNRPGELSRPQRLAVNLHRVDNTKSTRAHLRSLLTGRRFLHGVSPATGIAVSNPGTPCAHRFSLVVPTAANSGFSPV
jgi:hypothetical protein